MDRVTEKIVDKVPVILSDIQYGLVGVGYCYFLCFTDKRLIGYYCDERDVLEYWMNMYRWIIHKQLMQKKKDEINFLSNELKNLLESNEKNFDISYEDIEEIRLRKFGFKLILGENYPTGKRIVKFNFESIINKQITIELFKKFLSSKIMVK